MERRLTVAGLIGIATWVIEIPLAASVAHLGAVHARPINAWPTWWFLVALLAGLLVRTKYPAVCRRGSTMWSALGANAVATVLAQGLVRPVQPLLFVLMGVATGTGLPAASVLGAPFANPAWTGRLVALTVGGITVVHWGLDLLREVMPPAAVFGLTLLLLVGGWLALNRPGAGTAVSASAPGKTVTVAIGTPVSVGLFILLLALLGGISARFMLGTAAALSPGDLLVRLLFLAGVAAGSVLLHRGKIPQATAAAAFLLVLAFLAGQYGLPAAVAKLAAAAFGVLEPIPWFLLVRKAAASASATPWAGLGAALFVLRFGLAIPMTARIDEQFLVLMGLPGAMAVLLALLLVPDMFVPPTAGAPETELAPAVTQPEGVVAGSLLERYYGDRLSKREQQIGDLAIAGVSTREIAEQIFLTESTVKTHLKSLYRKTESENRHDLYRKLVAAEQADKARAHTAAASPASPAGALPAPLTRDPVTGLLDRQAFTLVAPGRLAENKAGKRPVGLVALRLFPVGAGPAPGRLQKQQRQVAIATILKTSLRGDDLVFRWGPADYLVLLPGEDAAGARDAGGRLCQKVRAWLEEHSPGDQAGVGCASTAEGLAESQELLAAALNRIQAP